MTSVQTNLLAQTASGTPGGELLRRYWHPVAVSNDLTDEHPIRAVRILSESLVLYRNLSGQIGLMQERCTHHGVLLKDGDVARDALVCPLHHWRFDVEGNCFVLAYQEKIYPINWAKARAYPVEESGGLIWAYLGPLPAPELPDYDVLTREDRPRRITVYPQLDEGWLTSDGETSASAIATAPDALWLRVPIDDTHSGHLLVEFAGELSIAPEPEIIQLGTSNGAPPSAPSSFVPYWAKQQELPVISEEEVETLRQSLAPHLAADGIGPIRYPDELILRP